METGQVKDGKHEPSIKNVFFSNHNFFKLWIAQFVSNTGSNITQLVLPLFIFYYTGSTLWLGVISLAEIIPIILISPYAGVFADRNNRKIVMICSDAMNTILILLVPLLVAFDYVLNKQFVLVGITCLVFLGASVTRFFIPARSASIPHLVTKDELGIAVSISQTTFQLIEIIGPIVGAAIATFIGYSFAFVLDGSTFVFSALVLATISTDLRPEASQNKSKKEDDLLLGTKKIIHIKSLRLITIIIAFTTFTLASLNSFLVAFVEQDLGLTAIDFGTTISIMGFSGVIAGVIMTNRITKITKPINFMSISLLLLGLVLVPFLVISQLWELFLIFLCIGSFNMLISIPLNIIFMRDTEDSYRGQAFSSLNVITSLFMIVGILFGVALAPIVGLRDLFFLNALLLIVIAVGSLFYLLFINDLDNPTQISQQDINMVKTIPD